MINFAILFLQSFLILVTHLLLCYLSCFTPQCISSGLNADKLTKLTMYAIWQSVIFDSLLNGIRKNLDSVLKVGFNDKALLQEEHWHHQPNSKILDIEHIGFSRAV